MDKITFREVLAPYTRAYVYLGRKRVGSIRKTKDGYAYFPLRSKSVGFVFPTVAEVKSSLGVA